MDTKPPVEFPAPEGLFDRLIQFSIRNAIWIMLFTMAWIAIGLYSYQKLSIDAVPDITNVQVQINSQANGFTAAEVEQRITYPIENAMAGMPNLEQTRSISRYGLSQVTIVFKDGTDIYWARQLINQRLQEANASLPDDIEPQMSPISTGLGEIYQWVIKAEPNAKKQMVLPIRQWIYVRFRTGLSGHSFSGWQEWQKSIVLVGTIKPIWFRQT